MWRPITLSALGLFTVVLVSRRWFFVVRVEGRSMFPTYDDGDRLLTARAGRLAQVRRGDVIVCQRPDRRPAAAYLIKRVLAVAGDPVPGSAGKGYRSVLPAATIWVQGDSPGYDSRVFGPLPVGEVVGKVVAALPLDPRPISV